VKRFVVLVALMVAAPAQAQAAPAAVRVAECGDRVATFEGDMRAFKGASRMQMRFTLQVRPGRDGRWARVTGPKLDTWVSAEPGKQRYVYDKRVENLLAPAEYRVRVRFRWLDADGAVVATARRVSAVCRQPDPRPDLHFAGIAFDRGRYLVTVRNRGRGASGAFAVSLATPGAEPVLAQAPPLAAGRRTVVEIDAAPCHPGESLQVVLDPDERVDEASEADDSVSVPCPGPG
jgi:hypothetical protein